MAKKFGGTARAAFVAFAAGSALPHAALAQIVEPIRPPPTVAPLPAAPPLAQPLPLAPPLAVPQTPTLVPTPAPVPAPAVPLQVVPPPPAAAEGDPPDGGDSCDCYATDNVPVYSDGVLIGSNPVRRWVGKSPDCCPEH